MRPPDMQNVAKAWKMTFPKEDPETGRRDGSVGAYLVEGPFHPMWNRWVMLAVHLRGGPGLPEPKLHFPEATHEFIILSLDPLKSDAVDPDHPPKSLPFMTPLDAVVQFTAASDAQAVQVLEAAVQAVVDGHASPDQDFRGFWKTCIPNTVDCLNGKHGHPAGHTH
jgi:hypothetical protein